MRGMILVVLGPHISVGETRLQTAERLLSQAAIAKQAMLLKNRSDELSTFRHSISSPRETLRQKQRHRKRSK